jgi:hypothetical protein
MKIGLIITHDYQPIEGKIAENLFGSPVEIKRIRLFVNTGESTSSIGFVNPVLAECYVKIQYLDGRFIINIDNEVKTYILNKALSCGFFNSFMHKDMIFNHISIIIKD